MKEVNNQNLWNFEIGSQESMNVSIWILIGFQQRDRQDSQKLNNDTFCRLPVTRVQCILGTENYPDARTLLNYDDDDDDDDDDYSQADGQINEAFRPLTKTISFNHIHQILISDLQVLGLMMLVVFYMFSIYDISKYLQLPNQLK